MCEIVIVGEWCAEKTSAFINGFSTEFKINTYDLPTLVITIVTIAMQ